VKKFAVQTLIVFLFITPAVSSGQGSSSSQKNALLFNLGQYIVNEVNLGYEFQFKENKSLEIYGGLIYQNEFWRKMSEEWTNSQYFYERGFGLKISHRIYRKPGEKGRRNFYSFGLNYQYLYFNQQWFETDHQPTIRTEDSLGNSIEILGTEQIYQRRFRNRFGIHFISGNIFPINKTFGIEIFYGIGLRGIFSNRYDLAVSESGPGVTRIYISNNRDEKFYIRPTIHAGAKFRIGW
jgi:hypothetical protein